ncbi:hypothetical protein FB45DRAFT_894523 [Roridomyces roridus]|uniref:Arrestin-like N-terminal domain-containing protein n=1 Tax=Roridomyces roridus TaxID=1738132 RepID=A0AAD7FZM2_9AGAR|nr:hypothetical protein FB45DRAFT_894523 [Roridomyces roridus]
MVSTSNNSISLQFQDIPRIAGETICGTVDLNLAQEDHIQALRIKWRGAIVTRIRAYDDRRNRNSTIPHRETIPLIHADQLIWTRGSSFPEPGSHVLSCPFQFKLPENLPPSFECHAYHRSGTISYSLEVVGERGLFRFNRRIYQVFSVLPAASQDQVLVAESLRQGWDGQWADVKAEERLRQGIWGGYSHAYFTISLPSVPSIPVYTPIPFSIRITTETKALTRSERPEDKYGKPLFPVPPTEVTITLCRSAEVRVRRMLQFTLRRHVQDTFTLQAHEPQVVIHEPEWVPKDDKDKGIWRREVHLTFELLFPFAPTSNTKTIDWMYLLKFLAPFPGIGNNLYIQMPIHLSPASGCPPPPIGAAGLSSSTYADNAPAGPPPAMFDLPPSYWAGEEHDWDDEKK